MALTFHVPRWSWWPSHPVRFAPIGCRRGLAPALLHNSSATHTDHTWPWIFQQQHQHLAPLVQGVRIGGLRGCGARAAAQPGPLTKRNQRPAQCGGLGQQAGEPDSTSTFQANSWGSSRFQRVSSPVLSSIRRRSRVRLVRSVAWQAMPMWLPLRMHDVALHGQAVTVVRQGRHQAAGLAQRPAYRHRRPRPVHRAGRCPANARYAAGPPRSAAHRQ